MTTQFFQSLEAVKNISVAAEPLERRWNRLQPLLDDPDVLRMFLQTLDNAEWIPVLRESGFFQRPAPTQLTPDGGKRHIAWPQSQYLARVARHDPDAVAGVFREIHTDNASITADMLDAALSMPAPIAATLVSQICDACDDTTFWYGFGKAAELCALLASGGQLVAALQLADALFTPRSVSAKGQTARGDGHWYLEGLEKAAPPLRDACGPEFCKRLILWLQSSIELRESVDRLTGRDYSFMWRPAIEEQEENDGADFCGRLVGILRDAIERSVDFGRLRLSDAIAMLEEQSFLVFKRLSIHLINRFADRDPMRARRMIMDRSLFERLDYKHEYALLTGQRWSLLSDDEHQEWLRWVDAGPSAAKLDSGEIAEEDSDQIAWWKYERLHWIRGHLEGYHRRFYDEMRAKYGEPELADMHVRSSVRWGHDSPISAEELSSLTFAEVVARLEAFVSEQSGHARGDIEAVASEFGKYVAARAAACSREVHLLHHCVPIFVSTFIGKMANAVAAGEPIDVGSVIQLCRWVIAEAPQVWNDSKDSGGRPGNQAWQGARDEIAPLIEAICKANSAGLPRFSAGDYSRILWELLENLAKDTAESGVLRGPSDPRSHDYLLFGINSPRGKAVGAALEYARWIANQTEGGRNAPAFPEGLEAMPEVKGFLELQINSENRTFETLAVIGSRIGLLYWLDREWLGKNAAQLFDLPEYERMPSGASGWAAWNAFLVWVNPHFEFYNLFRDEFEYAVAQSAHVNIDDRSTVQPMHRLAEHLIVLYGRGQLPIAEGKLVHRLITQAVPAIRRHIIAFVGLSMERLPDADETLVARLMVLWGLYWASHGPSDAKESPGDYLFGQWFSSGVFPPEWSIKSLEDFVEVVPMPAPENEVVPYLAKICDADILRSVSILKSIVDGDKEGWRIHMWRESATHILEVALKSSGAAHDIALELIDHLGRRGYLDFGKLLRQ